MSADIPKAETDGIRCPRCGHLVELSGNGVAEERTCSRCSALLPVVSAAASGRGGNPATTWSYLAPLLILGVPTVLLLLVTALSFVGGGILVTGIVLLPLLSLLNDYGWVALLVLSGVPALIAHLRRERHRDWALLFPIIALMLFFRSCDRDRSSDYQSPLLREALEQREVVE